MKKKYFFLIGLMLCLILPSNIFVLDVKAVSNESYLVTDNGVYARFNFSDLGIYYNNNIICGVFHIPIIFPKTTFSTIKTSDLSYTSIGSTTNFNKKLVSSSLNIIGENNKYFVVDYSFTIKATIGKTNIDIIPSVKGMSFSQYAWYNSSWQYVTPIWVDKTKVSSPLANFPVCVQLSDTIGDLCKSDGSDIRFVANNNVTLYSYYIERWVDNENRILWVNIPRIESSSNTEFNCYYGYSSAGTVTSKTNTFTNTNFVSVYNCNETSGNLADIKGINTFTASATPTYAQTGAIGKSFYIDSDNDFFSATTNFSINNGGGWSYWFKGVGDNGEGGFSIPYTASGSALQGIFNANGTYRLKTLNTGSTEKEIYSPSGISLFNGAWVFISIYYNQSTTTQFIYINGTKVRSCTQTGTVRTALASSYIGIFSPSYKTGANSLHAYFDDIKFYNNPNNNSWIYADYCNGMNTLLLFGTSFKLTFSPTNLKVFSSGYKQISLTWNKGTNCDYTHIRYNTSGYPLTITSGTIVYNGTLTSYVFSCPNMGIYYYFSVWGFNSSIHLWSFNNITGCNVSIGIIYDNDIINATLVNANLYSYSNFTWKIFCNATGNTTPLTHYENIKNASGLFTHVLRSDGYYIWANYTGNGTLLTGFWFVNYSDSNISFNVSVNKNTGANTSVYDINLTNWLYIGIGGIMEINIENTQLFMLLLLGIWLIFVALYLKYKNTSNNVMLGLCQWIISMPLCISISVISINFVFGYTLLIVLLILPLYLLIDAIYYSKQQKQRR